MKKLIFLFLLIFSALLIFAGEPEITYLEALPQETDWIAASTEIYSPDGLFSHINGGAELFLEYGFVNLYVTRFKEKQTNTEVVVEVYNMKNISAAYGIFMHKYGNTSEAESYMLQMSNNQTAMAKSGYYILINPDISSTKVTRFMKALVNHIDKNIKDTPKPSLNLLPEKNKKPGSERILKGAIAFQEIFPLGEGDMLWHSSRPDCYAADYKTSDNNFYNYTIAVFKNSDEAKKAYGILIENLDPYLEVINTDDHESRLKDWNEQHIIIKIKKERIEIFTRLPQPSIPEVFK